MRVKTKELLGAVRAAMLFASTDTTRPHLNAVRFEAWETTLRLISTDGHTLWCCEVAAVSHDAPGPMAAWGLPLDDAEDLARYLKQLDSDDVEVRIAADMCSVNGSIWGTKSRDFPQYLAMLAGHSLTPDKAVPEFAAGYVARACEAFALYSKGHAPEVPTTGSKSDKEVARDARRHAADPPVTWLTGGELDPALFYSPKFPAAFALVMPRRGDRRERAAVAGFLERLGAGGLAVRVEALALAGT